MAFDAETESDIEKRIHDLDAMAKHVRPVDGHNIFEFLKYLTDAGNAERFAFYNRSSARYCSPWGRWFIYDDKRWTPDDKNKITLKAKNVIRMHYVQLGFMLDDSKRAEIAAHLAKSESNHAINACLSLARGELPVVPDQLDRDPFLLNVHNGTIDLRTGELRDFDSADYITKMAGTAYDPAAECSQWLTFLDRILGGNQELITFLQKAVGYALSGDTSEQCLFILHGAGQNGKSTFLSTVMALLGDYATKTPITTFLQKKNETISNDIAALKGARFVSATEAGEGQRLAEPLIKELTGGDSITARFLYAEFFTFQPGFKLFIGTNHKPVIRGTDYAIWRRIRLIPFEVVIPEEERDNDLLGKLETELPGILGWALEGYRLWKAEGLKMPEEIRAAVNGYRDEMDLLAAFFEECCILDKSKMAKSSMLYHSYSEWAEKNGEHVMSNRRLAGQLKERGHDSFRQNDGIYWIGIGLAE